MRGPLASANFHGNTALQLFISILLSIMTPILLLSALGFGVQRRLGLDLGTLSKLQVHVLIPAGILYFLLSAKLPLSDAWPTFWFTGVLFAAHFAIGWGGAALFGQQPTMRVLMGLAVAFPNSGNYGIPLIQLTMAPDYLLHQTIMLSVHMLLITTLGLWLISGQNGGKPSLLATLFATPIIPAVALGFALKGLEVELPQPLAIPLKLLGEAFTPLALFLLGAQLSATNGLSGRGMIMLSVVLKLAAAPLLTFAMAAAIGFTPDLIALFVLGTAIPTGVVLTVLATQYQTGANFAATTVFLSTVASTFTVTAWIYGLRLAGYLPPLP